MDELIRMLTAKIIMTPTADLTCAGRFTDARDAMVVGGFEIVPAKQGDLITAYWHTTPAGSISKRKVDFPRVVSDGCDIPALVPVLAERRYVFVVGGDRVVGYIHFSDLNRPQVKVPFFVLFEALERLLVERLRACLTPESLRVALPRRAKRLLEQYAERQAAGADHSLATVLSFTEVLRAARSLGQLVIEDDGIELLSTFRNLVAHAGKDLVRDHEDVKRLAACQTLVRQLLGTAATPPTQATR
jgi:hypothetical protein